MRPVFGFNRVLKLQSVDYRYWKGG